MMHRFVILSKWKEKKGTTTDELIFILSDNGIPIYEISNYLDISVKHVEMVLSDG